MCGMSDTPTYYKLADLRRRLGLAQRQFRTALDKGAVPEHLIAVSEGGRRQIVDLDEAELAFRSWQDAQRSERAENVPAPTKYNLAEQRARRAFYEAELLRIDVERAEAGHVAPGELLELYRGLVAWAQDHGGPLSRVAVNDLAELVAAAPQGARAARELRGLVDGPRRPTASVLSDTLTPDGLPKMTRSH